MNNRHPDIQHAAALLRQGKLVAIPSETVYGLAADAKNIHAIAKIYAAKGRPSTNPLIIHLSNVSAITDWAINIPKAAYQLAERFWPGPLTLILPKHPSVPDCVTGNQNTVGLRIPNHPVTLSLLEEFNGGLAAPSANRFGRISPTTTAHVREELKDAVDYILEGGPCSVGIESTIVSLASESPVILRLGAIQACDIEAILGKKVPFQSKEKSEIIVPGTNSIHYAPEKHLYLLDKHMLTERLAKSLAQKKQVSVLSFSEKPLLFGEQHGDWIQADPSPIAYATKLYATLRMLDNSKGDCILVEIPPNSTDWFAIRDRLQRAACPK